ncbi:hypothetical protein [Bacillus sp. B15-48]|uniref:hypothetical protein n=1 Tax=Bacillus sp. B15-48 TaxID=1548601 RepID=UPI00193FD1A9|nr:hypothetical protein [Bacillus sp. B15-48]MBM4762745.1 hypothetical protein [Bacillus sp. B15-48]
MNLNQKLIWAEVKHKVLESAVMISDGYAADDVIAKLMEVVELLENTEPRG